MLDGGAPSIGNNAQLLCRLGVSAFQNQGWTGAGIAVGLADYGFDLTHPVFAPSPQRLSRFRLLHSQSLGMRLIDPTPEALLRSGYDPHSNYYGPAGLADPAHGAHGTMMASIAAGNRHDGFVGVAPDADLYGVHLDLPDTAWKEIDVIGRPAWHNWNPATDPTWQGWRSYADAPGIAEAIDTLYCEARDRAPAGIVINLSIGTWAGQHNGHSAVTRKIDEIVGRAENGDGPPCAVIVGAGNAGCDRGHVAGIIAPGAAAELVWQFQAGAEMTDKLEIWIETPADGWPAIECRLEPVANGGWGEPFRVAPGPTTDIRITGHRVGVADYVPNASAGLSRIRISLAPHYFAPLLPAAGVRTVDWRITLAAPETGNLTTSFHAWRERNDDPQRSTLENATTTGTLCDFACASKAVVVGGTWTEPETKFPRPAAHAPFASRGPAPWRGDSEAARAPHVAAPAHLIWGARSKSADLAPTSGTSAAAALVSGCAALLLQRAAARGERLDRATLIRQLTGNTPAENDTPADRAWRPDFGFGSVALDESQGDTC
jgi:hypothetical protein